MSDNVQNLAPVAPAAPASSKPSANWIATLVQRGALVFALIALVAISQFFYPGFLAPENIKNILSQSAPTGIIAIGMTLVMITRGFDLSVGSTYAAGATVYASLAAAGWPLPAAAAVTIVMGCVAGLVNGVIVTRLKVNPFVATLGTMSVFSGLALIYSKSSPFIVTTPEFTALGRASFLSIPVSVWLLVAFFAAGQLILSKTVYGRQLYAIGGNDDASRLAGLRTIALRTSTYAICGACAAIGGMIIASRLGIGQADIGATIALDAIAVVVIGGTSLLGGEGSAWRTALGLMIVAVLTNLLDSRAVSTHYQLVIKGVIVIAAVAADSLVRSRR
jgi:ribose transport system permease protein